MKKNDANDFLKFINIIKSISKKCDNIVNEASEGLDLSILQSRILLMIYFENDDIKISDISSKMAFASSNVSTIINTLVDKRCLTKNRSKEDQRTVHVSLTPNGYKTCEILIENMDGFDCRDEIKYINILEDIDFDLKIKD